MIRMLRTTFALAGTAGLLLPTVALAADKPLKATPIAAWDGLLEKGTMPDSYRPTLYDFLAHEALEFYQAGEQGAARPAWQHIYLFIGSYMTGDMSEASEQAGQIPGDNYGLGHVAQALVAKAMGDAARTRQALDRLVALAGRMISRGAQ